MKRIEPFSIVYEDDALVIVNKAAGIAVLADRWDDSKERLDELLNSYFASLTKDGTPSRLPFPHAVHAIHRIDRDTSGLVAFAKHKDALREYSEAFMNREVQKSYIAIVPGRPAWQETVCQLPLLVDGDRHHRTIIDKAHGKESETSFKVLGGVHNYTIIQCMPHTGRTHQIRVHLAALGHPIVCDPLYGNSKPVLLSSFKRGWRGDSVSERPLLERLGLHAFSIQFPNAISCSAPLPKDMAALVKQILKITGEDLDHVGPLF